MSTPAIPSAQPTPSDPKGWMAKLNAGAQLANVAFNWAQRCGYTLTSDDCAMLDKLRKQWDAAPNPIPTGDTQ